MLTVEDLSFRPPVQGVTGVVGVVGVEDCDIGPSPHGQDQGIITGTIGDVDSLILITDPLVFASRL